MNNTQQGHAAAQCNLVVLYNDDQGVPQNFGEAYFWLSLSVKNGIKNAAKSKDETALKLTTEELNATDRRVREWKPKKQGAVK